MSKMREIERPKDAEGIRRLIRRRKDAIRKLENLLQHEMPADIRRISQHRLKGERANLASWTTYLAKM